MTRPEDHDQRLRAIETRIARLEVADSSAARELALMREELRRLEGRVWLLATGAAGAGAAGAGLASALLGGG